VRITRGNAKLPQFLWIEALKRTIDDTLRDRAPTKLVQPSRRMTRSMTQDLGLGQDHSIVDASETIIPQRTTRSRAY